MHTSGEKPTSNQFQPSSERNDQVCVATQQGQDTNRMLNMQVQWTRRRGWSKKRWLDNIRDDMKEYNMTEHLAQNRSVSNQDNGRPITTCRRHVVEGEKMNVVVFPAGQLAW